MFISLHEIIVKWYSPYFGDAIYQTGMIMIRRWRWRSSVTSSGDTGRTGCGWSGGARG